MSATKVPEKEDVKYIEVSLKEVTIAGLAVMGAIIVAGLGYMGFRSHLETRKIETIARSATKVLTDLSEIIPMDRIGDVTIPKSNNRNGRQKKGKKLTKKVGDK